MECVSSNFCAILWILHACSTQFYVAPVTFLCIFDGFMSFFACALKSLNMPVFGETCEFCSCRWKVKNCVRLIDLDRKFNIVTELFVTFSEKSRIAYCGRDLQSRYCKF